VGKVLVIDVGTRFLKAFLFDDNGYLRKQEKREVSILSPFPGLVEQDPIELFDKAMEAVSSIVKGEKVDGIAVTGNRATTLMWDDKGNPLYNSIVWMDSRGYQVVKKAKLKIDLPEELTKLLLYPHASSVFIRWIIDNVKGVKEKVKEGKAFFGNPNSYLIWRLTGGKVHATDPSNASSTGLFDPYSLTWWDQVAEMLSIPTSILPEVKENVDDYGLVEAGPSEIKGVRIIASIADQQSSLLGQLCTRKGEAKVTNGSGSFVDVNTGESMIISSHGLIPMVSWKIGNRVNYMLEGYIAFSGELMLWLKEIGIIEDIGKIDDMATSVKDSNGVYLIPAFTGLPAPYNDPSATGLIIGLTRGVKKEHIVRAALESIAMMVSEIIEDVRLDAGVDVEVIRADGNLSRSDFLLEKIASFSGKVIERSNNLEGTGLGAALLALIGLGKASIDEIRKMKSVEKAFAPNSTEGKEKLSKWRVAVEKSRGWK